MATAKERVTTATDYVVLELRTLREPDTEQEVEAWVEKGSATSTTRIGAVTAVAGDEEGVWRPVPTRNWQRAIRSRSETTTKTKYEEVGDDEPDAGAD